MIIYLDTIYKIVVYYIIESSINAPWKCHLQQVRSALKEPVMLSDVFCVINPPFTRLFYNLPEMDGMNHQKPSRYGYGLIMTLLY